MKHYSAKKLALAGMFCAVAVVGSVFSFPVFGSKCAPVQHMVNILCAVLLGPYYGVGVAFVASLLRNLLGLGSLMAFPGSMFGALLCGIVFHKTHKLLPTLVGEVFGTSILGGLCAYPVAILLMGKHQLGKDLSNEDVASIKSFLNALTGKLPDNYIQEPALPPSGPTTPAADPN